MSGHFKVWRGVYEAKKTLEDPRNHKEETHTNQEELAEELRKEGFRVTQATVSRDIKELRLVKVLRNEQYCYAEPERTSLSSDRLLKYLKNLLLAMTFPKISS